MAQKARVVITGVGAIAPNGIGKEAFWEGLIAGRSGIRRITRFDASQFPCQIAGEVTDFEATAYINPQCSQTYVARFSVCHRCCQNGVRGFEV